MSFSPDEKGQGLVEYLLIFVLVLVVVIAVWLILKDPIINFISNLNPSLTPTP